MSDANANRTDTHSQSMDVYNVQESTSTSHPGSFRVLSKRSRTHNVELVEAVDVVQSRMIKAERKGKKKGSFGEVEWLARGLELQEEQ